MKKRIPLQECVCGIDDEGELVLIDLEHTQGGIRGLFVLNTWNTLEIDCVIGIAYLSL